MPSSDGNVIEQLQVNIEANSTGVNTAVDQLKDKLYTLNDILTTLGNNYGYTQNLYTLGKQFESVGAAVSNIDSGSFKTIADSIGYLGKSTVANAAVNIPKITDGLNGLANVSGKFPDLSGLSNVLNSINAFGSADKKTKKAISNLNELAKSLSSMSSLNGIAAPDLSWIGKLGDSIHQFGLSKTEKGIKNIPLLAQSLKELVASTQGMTVDSGLTAYVDALARLASTGAGAGAAANGVANSLKNYSNTTKTARISTLSLIGAVGAMKAAFYAIRRVAGFFKEAVQNASDLVEVQHVVNVTFGEYQGMMDSMAGSAIENYGMSELTAKKIGSRFQAMGMAMGFARGEMADMSISLTQLAGDMASFYNVEYADAAKSLEAIFTGQTRPMRQFGVDLTQATLQEYALSQGITQNISSMTQAEKTALRYQYVLSRLSMVEGDFVKTADTWANQIRMLKENFRALGIVLGRGLINALKPFVKGMNTALQGVTKFATNVLNALGKIFGWQVEMESSGLDADFASIGDDLGLAGDAADNLGSGAGDAAKNLGKAAKAAKDLKTVTLGIDELNLNQPDNSSSGSGSGGSGGSGGGSGGSGGGSGGGGASGGDVSFNVKETEKFYESMIDNLFDLGAYVGDTIANSLNSINWETIRAKARAFGKGLAEFFNGFFSTDAMGSLGETVAQGLNTALESLYGFATTFQWGEFGGKVREFIDNIFDKFDWQLAGKTIDAWVQGIADAIWGFLTNTDNQGKIIQGIGQVILELDGKTIALLIVGFTIKSALASGVLAKAVKAVLFGTGGTAAAGAVVGAGEVTAEATVTSATVAEGSGLLAQGGLIGALKAWAAPLLANPFTVSAGGLIGLGYVMYKAKQYFVDGKEATSSFEKSIFNWFQGKIDKVKERLAKGEGDEGLEYRPNAYINPNYIMEDSAQDSNFGKMLQEWFSSQTSRLKLAYKGKITTAVETVKEWINNIKTSWDENSKDGVGVNAKLRTGPIDIKGWWSNISTWWGVRNNIVGTKSTTTKSNTNTWWESIKKWWGDKKVGVGASNTAKKGTVSGWWGTIKGWFGSHNFSIGTALSTGESTVRGWASNIKTWWDRHKPGLGTSTWHLKFPVPTISWEKVTKFGITATLPSLGVKWNTYATGGFPDMRRFSLFSAGEGGVPEMLGTVGGRTAVAGGVEITGIKDAVNNASAAELAVLQSIISLLNIIADKNFDVTLDGRSLVSAVDNRKSRNGFSFT